MIAGLVEALVGAWILSLFGLDEFFVKVMQPFTTVLLTTDHYYFAFGALGLIVGIISET